MADPIISRGLGNIAQTAGELSKTADKGQKAAGQRSFEQIRAEKLGQGPESAGYLGQPGEVSKVKEVGIGERVAAKDGIVYQPLFEGQQTAQVQQASMWQALPDKSVQKTEATDFLRGVNEGQHRMEEIVSEMKSGREYSRQELLGIQAEVYMLSEQVQIASKLVDAAMQSLKSVMQQQI